MAMANFTIKVDLRPCYVDTKKALFHKWINKETPILKVNAQLNYDEVLYVQSRFKEDNVIPKWCDVAMQNRTLGLVEYEDGTVAEVEPTRIIFADRTIDEYIFEERKINNDTQNQT